MLDTLIIYQIHVDKGKNDALICDSCMEKTSEAFEMRERIRNSEKFYFTPLREEMSEELMMVQEQADEAESFAVDVSELLQFDAQKMTMKDLLQDEDFNFFELQDTFKTPENEALEVPVSSFEMPKKAKIHSMKCLVCGKVLSSKYILKSHIRNFHQRKKNFECNYCPEIFYSKRDLAGHRNRCPVFSENTNENRPFTCTFDGCDMSFKTESIRKLHQKLHLRKRFEEILEASEISGIEDEAMTESELDVET